jgi:hypothetical protein
MSGGWRGANLALAFILELCALAALAYWGVWAGDSTAGKIVLGIGAPVVAAILWGLFAAPRALVSRPPLRFVVKVLVFGAAAIALYVTGHHALAVIFAVIVIINSALLHGVPQPDSPGGLDSER